MTAIARFPISTMQRIWNRHGARAVNCVVSERWLRFGQLGRTYTGYLPSGRPGTPVSLDVMTDVQTDEGEKEHKICTLVVTYEELKALVDRLESELPGKDTAS